jgi:hypothetical protein
MRVYPLNVEYIHLHWDVIEGYLRPALELSGVDDYNIDQLKVFLINRQWVLYVVERDNKIAGCISVAFSDMPNSRIAFVTAIGGKFISDKEAFAVFKSLLKASGATKIQGMARESVARLWRRIGFDNKQTLVEYKL